MSNTAIIEIEGTGYSKAIVYNTTLELLCKSEEFVCSCGFDLEGYIMVNVYEPEHSLEVPVNKFYV